MIMLKFQLFASISFCTLYNFFCMFTPKQTHILNKILIYIFLFGLKP